MDPEKYNGYMRRCMLYVLMILIVTSCDQGSQDKDVSLKSFEYKNTDTSKTQPKPKASNSLETGTMPIDDQTHLEAAVMAKEFVVKKLNVPSTPNFNTGSLDWVKLKHNIYKISSVVNVDDSNSVKHTYNWVVKLKYKNGDWTDINNWNLIDIRIAK